MQKIDCETGLTKEQVEERKKDGLVNYNELPKTKTIRKIITDNIFNYFNFLNLALGLAVFSAGVLNKDILNSLKNCLFMGVIITNSIISIIEEIISKRITDKLSVLQEAKVETLRDGEITVLSDEEIVMDDIIKLSMGHQIVVDCDIIEGELEVNEALITGEPDIIRKKEGDTLLSGSYIVAGNAKAQVIHIGADNYAAKITKEAKYDKPVNSVIMASFTKLLKILSVLLIPIGIIFFFNQYKITGNIPESTFATVAALIGMIPEGLVLLTSSVMAVGVIKLYKVKVLVQQLYAIETLARIDTICLDKTGTITEGKMKIVDIIPTNDNPTNKTIDYFEEYANFSEDSNPTMLALKHHFDAKQKTANDYLPFSSERKYSAIEYDDYTMYLGAPEIIGGNKGKKETEEYINDYRVIALGKSKEKISDKLPNDIELIGYALLEDIIRPSAKETLNYFKKYNVNVKIISGDNAKTVTNIARKVGLDDAEGINLDKLDKDEIEAVIDKYQIFGRVTPVQKKWIVSYLKSEGHTVAMTGDGVNDVLALKESDCAISIKSGSDAARNVAQLILLNDDFNSLPNVVAEGRQSINNVERSASLLLVKTIYTISLILFSIILSQKYFFIPIQLTFITSFTIGTPSFILALEPNNELVKGNFLIKVLAKALPTALTVVFNVALVTAFSELFNLSYDLQSTLCVYVTTITGLLYLYKICKPFTWLRGTLFFTMLTGFVLGALLLPGVFELIPINYTILLIVFVLSIDSLYVYKLLNYIITLIFHKIDDSIKVESNIYSWKKEEE